MDKVKLYLTILKKHHFWVLIGIAAICGFGAWWIGAGAIQAATAASESTVKSAYQMLNIPDPVNPSFAEAVDKAHGDLKKQAFVVWQQQYAAQQDLLRWPEHLGKAEFIDQIAALRPDEPIPPNLRLRYRNLIFPKAWENLQLIIDMRRPKPLENAAAGKAGGPPTAPMGPIDPSMVELIGIVDWSLANRTDLEARYFFDPNQPPTDKKVRLTQEDLWVFEDMCVVIAGTNKYVAKEQGVELDTGNAAIKRIESLDVAQWAVDAAQKDRPIVWLPPQSGLGESNANPGMNMSGPGAMSYGDAGAAGAVPLSAADMETKADELLLDGRYLKDDGQPLPATELTGTPPYTEFKQIFIRMKLMVDQRRIPELLTACANAPLPIEVRRLRVESMGDAAAGQAGAMPGAMPGMMPPGMGGHGGGLEGGKGMGGMKMGGGGGDRFGGEMPRGGPPAMPPPGAMGAQPGEGGVEAGPYDVSLELCGVVTLFNRPDETKLGMGSAADPGKKVSSIPSAAVQLPGQHTSGGFGSGAGAFGPGGGAGAGKFGN